MLFRLNVSRAVVVDVPMDAVYGDENSSLKINEVAGEFLIKHIRNFFKRIFYNYYLRDMSIASFELPIGLFSFVFGFVFGIDAWFFTERIGPTPTGTVMLSVLPIILGVQMILAFFSYDISAVPRKVIKR